MKIAIQKDKSGWLESDYRNTRHVLDKMEKVNPDQHSAFIENLKDVESLEDYPPLPRCRLIYFFLSTYIDWRDTYSQVFHPGGKTTLLYEKVYTGDQTINIDFQHITNQISEFNPSPEQVEEWGKIFGNALKHREVPDQVSSGIVRNAGKMRKRRQK